MIWVKKRNVNKVTGRNGRVYFYHRPTGTRLPDDPASTEFARELERLNTLGTPRRINPGTLSALIAEYRGSSSFTAKAEKTRKDYLRYLDFLGEKFGDMLVADLDREFVITLREALSETPRKADYVVQILRLLFSFAIDRPSRYGLIHNPASRPGRLSKPEGYRPFEEYEIAAFREYWKPDTLERVTFELFLNTGQRGGDICSMVRAHYFGGRISVRQEKTGERVVIPVSSQLLAVLDPWLIGHQHIALLTTENGHDLKPRYMRERMREAFDKAGLPNDCKLHGLRYTFAVVAREIGLEWTQIAAILGHRTAEMMKKYIEKIRNAEIVIARLDDARKNDD